MIDRTVRWLTAAALTVVGVAAALGNYLRAQDVDPQYTRDIVERTITYGGAFYRNGIHNKGPLEPMVYLVASWVTTYAGLWYAISILIALAAAFIAYAAASTARLYGAERAAGLAVGVVVFVHLTLSTADYAGVLYSRNLIAVLLAAAWLLAIDDRFWRSGAGVRRTCLAVGILLGLAVQTIFTAALTAGVIGLVALAMTRLRLPRSSDRERATRLIVGASAITFLSAPLYYAIRGSFTEFWAGWWTQAGFMSTGTGRSLAGQFGLGAHQFGEYYSHRPLAFLLIAAFVTFTAIGWGEGGDRFRVVHAGVILWLAGAWIELALSQRYSSHYFIVTTLPSILMGAMLAGHLHRALFAVRRPRQAMVALPLAALVLSVFLSGTSDVMDAIRRAANFTSPGQTLARDERNTGGEERASWAVLDLVTKPGGPLLAWTNEPWPYLKFHRVSATRFIWKSFLIGEIYLGRTGPQFVVPHAWEWFEDDVAQTKPVVYFQTQPRTRGTPFDALISSRFKPVLVTPHESVFLRRDVARDVVAQSATALWEPIEPPPPGWDLTPDGATYRVGRGRLRLSEHGCFRLDGTAALTGEAKLRFRFSDTEMGSEPLNLVWSASNVVAGSDAVNYLTLPTDPAAASGPVPFSLVVGRRAAVLVVAGAIQGALRLPSPVAVDLYGSRAQPVTVSGLQLGKAPARSGC
jgi:hypothetical protein